MDVAGSPEGKRQRSWASVLAARDERLNKIHGGKNAGRACWVIAGTFCEGKVQGTFAQKYQSCAECPFYKQIRMEEGSDYQTSLVLLKKLKVLK